MGQKKSTMVMIGPPGSGKGTQAENIISMFPYTHLSTGDILREAIKGGTELGIKAEKIINEGGLIDDETMIDIITETLTKSETNILLDGYPRTLNQAEALDSILTNLNINMTCALNFCVPECVLEKRITGRRIHQKSGRVYHIDYKPPKVPGIDDISGEPLIQREDDTSDILKSRLARFNERAIPILNFYSEKGLLKTIDGSLKPNQVFNQISNHLESTTSSKISQNLLIGSIGAIIGIAGCYALRKKI